MKTTSKEKKGLKHQHEEIELKDIIEQLEMAGETNVKLVLLMSKVTGKRINHIEMA